MSINALQQPDKEHGTWKRGIVVLFFLVPLFFMSYGFANAYASYLSFVPSIVFAWEQHIPLWAWSIVPYWSIDLFYALSLLLCWNTFELKQQTLRLLCAQVISISCFLLFPLKFSFERPELSGFFGFWFDLLMGFDKPFNQAPSLHIVLLVILWDFYRRHSKGAWKYLVDFWSILIAISVLTTWQHHFIDIPTGIIVGAFCLWLFPVATVSPFKNSIQKRNSKHVKLAAYYLFTAAMLCIIALYFKNTALWLLYPAFSLLLVSFAYLLVKPNFFQKQANGKMTNAALILFAPYIVIAWLNSRLWTLKHQEDCFVIHYQDQEIYLGRLPSQKNRQNYQALFDCCAELACHSLQSQYQAYTSLDLIPLEQQQLQQAVVKFDLLWQQLQDQNQSGAKLLIFCALGYSRSTAILAAWLLKNGVVNTVEDAMCLIKAQRPWVVLKEQQIQQLKLYSLHLA